MIEIKNKLKRNILIRNDETNFTHILKPNEKANTDYKYIIIEELSK